VNRSRHELLAGSTLALDENRRPTGRGLDDQVEDLPHALALADDVAEFVVALLDVLPQGSILVDETTSLHGVANYHEDFVVLEWLGDVVECAVLHGRYRAFDRRVSGDDDNGEILVNPLQFIQRRDAVQAGHHDVDDGRIKGSRACQLETLGAR
jgi:hypothetical protein